MDRGNALDNRITSVFPELTQSQRKLARYILDNGLFASFASAAELGKKVGVSAATVVRFCQTLGYEGFPELQVAVRASLPTYIEKAQRIEKLNPLDKDQTAARVFELDTQNLARTIASLDTARFSAAVNALSQASDILLVAAGVSAGPAFYFAHSLKVIGLNARAVLNGGVPLALELVSLKSTSLMVGIGVWRYVAETVAAMERAKNVGAARIAITDSIVSPLAQHADHVFQVATDGAAHALSLTSSMALINAFIAALAFARPDETARALQGVDEAYRQGKLLMIERPRVLFSES